jgi:hypothetical protein
MVTSGYDGYYYPETVFGFPSGTDLTTYPIKIVFTIDNTGGIAKGIAGSSCVSGRQNAGSDTPILRAIITIKDSSYKADASDPTSINSFVLERNADSPKTSMTFQFNEEYSNSGGSGSHYIRSDINLSSIYICRNWDDPFFYELKPEDIGSSGGQFFIRIPNPPPAHRAQSAGNFSVSSITISGPANGPPCGDVRDQIVAEYPKNGVYYKDPATGEKYPWQPLCTYFSQSARGPDYTFQQYNTGDYDWALVRQEIVDVLPQNGVNSWLHWLGRSTPPKLNSGYRSPGHNADVTGAVRGSRHLFGSAVDLQNKSRTFAEWQTMKNAAIDAGAEYVEPWSAIRTARSPCYSHCVHAEWGDFGAGYAQ